MRHSLLFKLALAVGFLAVVAAGTPAEAQRYGGGHGFRGYGGGFRGGGFAGRGFYGRPVAGPGRWYGGAWRGAGWRGAGWYGGGWRGTAWRGAAWRAPGRYWGGYGYRRYGYWPYAGAPFIGGLVLGGLAATYPRGYGYDGYPYAYPYVVERYSAPVYREVYTLGPIGAYCRTPVRTCRLIDPAEVGGGCSCRVQGGRVRGAVVP
ncbi:MAG: hypothetical protein DI527_02335 [Chelatococcus sp.]|nr:MAG: hypothetical protein DI527_02335 [Chelatococcus sp.]